MTNSYRGPARSGRRPARRPARGRGPTRNQMMQIAQLMQQRGGPRRQAPMRPPSVGRGRQVPVPQNRRNLRIR